MTPMSLGLYLFLWFAALIDFLFIVLEADAFLAGTRPAAAALAAEAAAAAAERRRHVEVLLLRRISASLAADGI